MSLAALLLTGATTAVATPAATAAEKSWLTFTVGLKPGVDAAALFERLNIESKGLMKTIPQLNAVQADLAYEPDKYGLGHDKMLDVLRADPQVRYAETEEFAYQFPPAAHTLDGSELDVVRLPRVRSGSAPVTVAVIGNGVTPNRELPAERVVAGHDATGIYRRTTDLTGRGTMAAGIIAGDSGICSTCKIMPIRLTLESDTTQSLSDSLARGIVWATDNGAQVITTAAYLHVGTSLIREAVRYATGRGVLVVASAGTDVHNGGRVFPAGFDEVLAVSAVTTSGQHTGRGNHNTANDKWIDVAAAEGAPAVDPADAPGVLGGVEGSTAVVAGTAALAFASKPGVTAAEVRAAITGTTTTAPGSSLPLLNAGAAVYSLTGADTAAPEITSTGLTTDQLITGVTSFRPTAVDDTAVDRIELHVGGTEVATRSNPWERMHWAPPAGFTGRIAVTLRAVDVAGRSSSATTTVRVDTAGPAGSIVSPAAGARIRGSAKVVFRGAADVASAEVNGVAMRRAGNDWSATVAPSGGRLVVEAADKDGYRSRFTRTVVVDDEGPTATVNPKQNTRVRGTFTTSLTAVKDASGVAKAELWANGRYLGTGYSKQVATGTGSGNVKLVWKLTDRLGNTRGYTRTVIADNKAPTLSITKAPGNKAKVKGTVKVAVKASDTSGVARVELLVNGKVVATDKTSGYVLGVDTGKQKKTMAVRVRAYDKLGNVAYTVTRTWYRK